MPAGLKNRPRLSPWIQPYLEAYQRLDRRRQMGYSIPQPLTTSAILEYGSKLGFKFDLTFFFRVISELDDVYMAEVYKKQQAELNKSKAKSKAKGRRCS